MNKKPFIPSSPLATTGSAHIATAIPSQAPGRWPPRPTPAWTPPHARPLLPVLLRPGRRHAHVMQAARRRRTQAGRRRRTLPPPKPLLPSQLAASRCRPRLRQPQLATPSCRREPLASQIQSTPKLPISWRPPQPAAQSPSTRASSKWRTTMWIESEREMEDSLGRTNMEGMGLRVSWSAGGSHRQ
jgi:hypothetical protein